MLLCEALGVSLLFCWGRHVVVLVACLDFAFCVVRVCCFHCVCCWGCFPFWLSECVAAIVSIAGVVVRLVIEVGFRLLVRDACGWGCRLFAIDSVCKLLRSMKELPCQCPERGMPVQCPFTFFRVG